MSNLLSLLLDFCGTTSSHPTPVFKRVHTVDYPRDDAGNLCAAIHPDLAGASVWEEGKRRGVGWEVIKYQYYKGVYVHA